MRGLRYCFSCNGLCKQIILWVVGLAEGLFSRSGLRGRPSMSLRFPSVMKILHLVTGFTFMHELNGCIAAQYVPRGSLPHEAARIGNMHRDSPELSYQHLPTILIDTLPNWRRNTARQGHVPLPYGRSHTIYNILISKLWINPIAPSILLLTEIQHSIENTLYRLLMSSGSSSSVAPPTVATVTILLRP